MDLKLFSPRTRRTVLVAWTVVLGAVYFVVIPAVLLVLTEARAWPAWRIPGGRIVGACLATAGLGLVGYCNHLFTRIGRGSIVPIDPTRQLVVVGPYRYSRNPVFVGYLAMLSGMFLASGAAALLAYTVAFFFYLEFFIRREEPDLLARFGDEYHRYMESVPRWVGLRAGGRTGV
jgi:protein-S-isoprenylcysteine O-methyltransferase Ste14